MIRYLFRRLLMLIPVIIAVSFIVFTLMDLAPGDALSGWDLSGMNEEQVAQLRASLGLDDPLIVRYGRYMLRLIQGDLGASDLTGISVWETFMSRLPNTLLLAFAALVIGVSVAIPLGILAARKAGTIFDNLITAFTMIGMSMPGFWLGIMMLLFFSLELGWFPASGFRDGWRSLVLPAVVTSLTMVASTTRQTRSSMLEVLGSDYLRTARAKGVPERKVINKHALGNALIPIVTNAGLGFGIMVAGTAVIEAVFAWPGIGRYVVESVSARDVTATTGAVIMTTVLYVMVQLLVDLTYAIIDPRIKSQYTRSRKKKKKTAEIAAPAAAKIVNETASSAAQAASAETVGSIGSAKANEASADTASEENIPAAAFAADKSESTANTIADAQVGEKEASVSFATRTDMGSEAAKKRVLESADGKLLTAKYKKRSQIKEVIYHISKNPGAMAGVIIIGFMIGCFIASFFIPFSAVTSSNMANRFLPPSLQYLFGTDPLGRNLFVRVIYAARFSMPIGIGATTLAAAIGVSIGSFAGYYEGTLTDEVSMRFSDTLASIPGILLGMVIISTLGRTLTNLIIAVSVSAIPVFIRITRASILTIKDNEYVEAARAIGISNLRIIFTQILPNGVAPIIIVYTNVLGLAILISAGLSFLGFGIPVPNPEWGALVSAGRDHVQNAPWLTAFPGLFIMLTVMAFNLLGDGFRDAFDPKLKKR